MGFSKAGHGWRKEESIQEGRERGLAIVIILLVTGRGEEMGNCQLRGDGPDRACLLRAPIGDDRAYNHLLTWSYLPLLRKVPEVPC